MIKRYLIFILIGSLLITGCATKSYVLLEDERNYGKLSSADSTLFVNLSEENVRQDMRQDSVYSELSMDTDSLFLDLMGEIYRKDHQLDSLQRQLRAQSRYIDSLKADVDTLQALETRFKDADYSLMDLSRVKSELDSLVISEKHLSRELQYMIRDLNLIERNLMDIMNYSMNSMKSQMRNENVMMQRSLYKNSSTAQKMIMVYLMTNSSNDPNALLGYIDSIYAMGPALDTVDVRFGAPADTTSNE